MVRDDVAAPHPQLEEAEEGAREEEKDGRRQNSGQVEAEIGLGDLRRDSRIVDHHVDIQIERTAA